jgi:hypothetical protein
MTDEFQRLIRLFNLQDHCPVPAGLSREEFRRRLEAARRHFAAVKEVEGPAFASVGRGRPAGYESHCWRCKAHVSTRLCSECDQCHYLVCVHCGECLCYWLANGGYAWHRRDGW